MTKTVIKIQGLTSGYNGNTVLKDINLNIPGNEIVVILGTSGCGKTTLLKHIIGLLNPGEGKVELLGKNVSDLYDREYNELMKNTGVLFQNGAMLNSITVGENIAIPLEQHTDMPPGLIKEVVKLKLSLVGLSHAYDLFPSQLSGGMRKRAALARAIALDPKVLFADEPGAGLDPVTAASLDALLLSLKDQFGMTLVVVTHEVASIKRIADKIVFLDKGRMVFYGPIPDAMTSGIPQITDFFLSAEKSLK